MAALEASPEEIARALEEQEGETDEGEQPPPTLAERWETELAGYLDADPYLLRPSWLCRVVEGAA